MKRVKGRYVAIIEADFDIPMQKGMRTADEIMVALTNGETDHIVKNYVSEIFEGDVVVTRQYADAYEIEDDSN